MLRPAVLLVVAALALAACGGHDKAGGASAVGGRTIEVAIRDGSARLLAPYAEALRRDAPAPTKVAVRTRWRAQARDSEARTIADVRSGRIAFAAVPARVLDTLGVDAFAPLLAPFAVESLDAEQRALAGDVGDRALPALRRLGVVGVAVLPGDLRHPLGLTRPLVRPVDYAGAYIGVRDSALQRRAFRRLGASVGTIAGEDYAGYDGIESDLPSIEADRADLGAASLAPDVTLWPRILVVIANPDAWQRIGAARQRAMRNAARDSLGAAIAALQASDADAYGVLCRRGEVPLVHPSEAAMRRALGIGGRSQASRTVHPPCRPVVPPRRAGATAVDGVWTFAIDAADLRRVHTPRDDVIPENWGRHVVVLWHGRFALTQEDAQACTWAYGAYDVHGDRIAIDMSAGGGHGPNDAVNRPGEHFEFSWSRFKDTLQLATLRGVPAPNTFVAAAWRRIADDPRSAPLSGRCPPPPKALQF
jgi:TRAP-type C4-dicarboxylate transport system substrate-binding protein